MEWRFAFIVFLALGIGSKQSKGQERISGAIKDLDSKTPLARVQVMNLTLKTSTLSDTAGRFSLDAAKGNLLTFKLFGYLSDTLMVVSYQPLEILLPTQQHMLDEVIVRAPKMSLGSLKDPYFHGQTIITQYNKKLEGSGKPRDIGGIVIRVPWGRNTKAITYARIAQQFANYEEIDQDFTMQNVGRYVPLKDSVLKDFIELYKPDVKTYKQTGFNLAVYLNDCYKEFKSLPHDKRKLQRLPKIN